jgi:hypothetical protein
MATPILHPLKMKFALLLLCLPFQLAWPQTHPLLKLHVAKALETPGNCLLSSIASEVRYVPLEANPGSFIQNIDQYAISDDLILVKAFVNNRGCWIRLPIISVFTRGYLIMVTRC